MSKLLQLQGECCYHLLVVEVKRQASVYLAIAKRPPSCVAEDPIDVIDFASCCAIRSTTLCRCSSAETVTQLFLDGAWLLQKLMNGSEFGWGVRCRINPGPGRREDDQNRVTSSSRVQNSSFFARSLIPVNNFELFIQSVPQSTSSMVAQNMTTSHRYYATSCTGYALSNG